LEVFKIIYSVLGGLGIFFYGMKNMSDSLQVVAGDLIKNAINVLTNNRFFAVSVGIVVTMLVQSSSVTTVMVVGFVNAGLMNLFQAIGVIFGANIGTTITGWIISIKIGKYGLLFIGLGIFPTLFGKSNRTRQIGRLMFGIGLIFFGLEIMSNAFKPLRKMPEFLDMMAFFSEQNYVSYLACVFMGAILTMIIQSSSAMLGLTMALATSGVIQFHTAAALVLGENIGTTITALLASVGGNIHAKRASLAHATFNTFGVLVMISVFPYYIELIDWIIPSDPNFLNAQGERPNVAVHIATGHTIFNVTATLVFLPFINQLAKFVTKMIPDKKGEGEDQLLALGVTSTLMAPTALLQAEKEILIFRKKVDDMFILARDYIIKDKPEAAHLKEIKRIENEMDLLQKEITVFLGEIIQKDLTEKESFEAQAIVRLADEMESVTDYIDKFAIAMTRFKEKIALKGSDKEAMLEFFDRSHKFFLESVGTDSNLKGMPNEIANEQAKLLRREADNMREAFFTKFSKEKYPPLLIMSLTDMVGSLRKVVSHSLNISQAINGFKNETD
jgi:phosphate:Na+ symporter